MEGFISSNLFIDRAGVSAESLPYFNRLIEPDKDSAEIFIRIIYSIDWDS